MKIKVGTTKIKLNSKKISPKKPVSKPAPKKSKAKYA